MEYDDLFKQKLEELDKMTVEEIQGLLSSNIEQLNQKPKKLIDCAHEIVFTVTANVLMENEKREIIGTEEVCTKNFHIPVPVDKDYKVFMKAFFEHIEKCLLTSIKETN